ncbi:TadE/TadG family type IV pilus assembly protein [Janibacter sp. G1551]|uniref:TadE/TadG family type IV pilus assembly protein n=1 Tax=Janibacter sp. G1551 TaxID=3420440 RepID=UPI003D075243
MTALTTTRATTTTTTWLRARWARLFGEGGRESGSAIVEFIVLAVVLLIPLVYLVLALARVQAGSYAVTQAAREAGRTFITAGSEPEARQRAAAAAELAFADQGFGGAGELTLACAATPCLTPQSDVMATATVVVPLPFVPDIAAGALPLSVPITATQVSVVPRYVGVTP